MSITETFTSSGQLVSRTHDGPLGDGSTDDTAEIQAKIDALPATGGIVHLPPGRFHVPSGGITVNKPVKFVGAGSGDENGTTWDGMTVIECGSATANLFTVTADGCTFADLVLLNTSGTTPTAGAGIRFANGNYLHLTRVTVAGFYVNVNVENGGFWTITDSVFADCVKYSLWLRNISYGDFGGYSIHGNVFVQKVTTRVADAAVRWESGGGLKFFGNKINGWPNTVGFNYGLDIAVADGVSTIDFQITGNSMENCVSALCRITTAGPLHTGTLKMASIVGNQFGECADGVWIGAGTADSTLISNNLISGNVFCLLTGHAIHAAYTADLCIGPNHDYPTSSPEVPIYLAQGCIGAQFVPMSMGQSSHVVFFDYETLHNAGSSNRQQSGHYVFQRGIPSTTSSAWSELWHLRPPQGSAGFLEFTLAGIVTGQGAFFVRAKRAYTLSGSTVTLTTIDTDTVIGPTMDWELSLGYSGQIVPRLRLNVAGGTNITGRAVVTVDGMLGSVYQGATNAPV